MATDLQNPTTKTTLHGKTLREDPRVIEAKRLLREAVAEHGSTLNQVNAPEESFAEEYQAMLNRFAAVRGGPTFWPYLSSGIGNGPYIELADGSVKLDFIGGIGVHGAGHNHPAMIDAAVDAAIDDTVMQGNLQQNPPSLWMNEKLIQLARQGGAAIEHCLLSTSGAMANENALKIAMHHQAIKHNGNCDRVIAFDNAFAGRTLALAALTDRPKYRMGLPLTINVDYLPFLDPDHTDRSTRWAVDELKRLLGRHPGKYAAFWAEPIIGEGGYYPGSHDFFGKLCEILREHGVPIIFDEVQSFGRTSKPFAFQHYGLDQYADIVTVGKITQVCATLYSADFNPKGPILSQTFTGSSSMIACGSKMLELMDERGCFGEDGSNMQLCHYFAKRLAELAERYPGKISGPFGEGMMIAFTPGDGSLETAKSWMDTMYNDGLLGFVCGADPVRMRFLPPPTITTTDHIDEAMKLLEGVASRM